MSLAEQKCEACRRDAPRVDNAEAEELLRDIPGWEIQRVDDIPQLQRTFKFDNFSQSLAFANQVGEMADAENHHPTLTVDWGKLKVVWWTHKIKGLHKNDFIMAAKVDALE